MRKIFLLLLTTLLLVDASRVKAQLVATGNDSINVLCYGDNSGYASVGVSGGVMPYTYQWSDGQITQGDGNLTAGTYTVTITDASIPSYTTTATVTITQPPLLDGSTSSTSATCGSSNGTGSILASGGISPYTYQWSDGQTTATATGLTAGVYYIMITDANGCNSQENTTVANSSDISLSLNPIIDVSCFGGSNGSAKVNPSGGATPYTYIWEPGGQTTQTATGLSAGVDTVKVKDASGCNALATVTITQPAQIRDSIASFTSPACNGSTGTATVGVKGGTKPYTYSWSTVPVQTTVTATGLSAGSYTVTVKDKNGCTQAFAFTITQPNTITETYTIPGILCNGGTTNATVNSSGGTSSYKYSWSNGQTTNPATGLTAGTYTITITDKNGCTTTSSVTITQPQLLTVSISNSSPLCNGTTTTATAGPSGGTSPYTYSWSNGQTNNPATGLSAGTYTLSVTDNNGCAATSSVTITQPTLLTVSINAANPLCNGATTTATANPSGGTSPYTYSWSNGQTTNPATGLSAGTYTLTLTDNNGCTATSSVTITQPSLLTVGINSANPSCNGGLGYATANPSGGVSPYTYSWSNGQTNNPSTGLSAGTYTLTVTDNNGCMTTSSVTITQPTLLTVNISSTNLLCNGATTTATANPSGGTSPYTYSWSNGQTNNPATGLSAGTYTVTITDNAGCTQSSSVTITQPAAISLGISSTSSGCTNNIGTATVSSSGGTSPYTYLWSNGQTTNPATGLSAATYTITVEDNAGCTQSATITVTQPITISLGTSSTSSGCTNNIGTATVSASGGTSPYTYSWSNGQTTNPATGLSAGTYTITVKDNTGCIQSTTVLVTQPVAISLNTSTTLSGCFNNTGTATVSVSGGTSPYTYSWSNGQTNNPATGLSAGSYSVTVTDNNGCTATTSVTVSQPSPLTIPPIAGNNPLCNGGIGSATANPNGGTSPYTYAWNPSGQTTATATGLTAGTYTVTVEDVCGNTQTASVVITQPPGLSVSANATTNVICNGNSTGIASSTVSGGTSPYTYTWNPSGQTTANATGLTAGTYTVTVEDACGASSTASVVITQPVVLNVSANAATNVICNGNSTGIASSTVSGGTSPYTYTWNPSGQTTANATGLTAGTYTVTVEDACGASSTASVIITQPVSLSISANAITNVSCNGGNNGIASSTITGGTSPYTYTWAPSGQTTANATGLSAGTYTVTVKDACGALQTTSVVITQPTILSISASTTTNVTCNGNANGSASSTVSGGGSPYTYTWAPSGQTTANATGLSAGTYTVTIKDACGASQTTSVVITQPTILSVSTNVTTNVSCNGNLNGSASSTVTGGTSSYTYSWTPSGQTTANATGLGAGTYTITVTDKNGCTSSATAIITQPNLLTVSTHVTAYVSCNGNANGNASSTVTGGNLPYTYTWNPSGQTTANATGLSAGTYTITVTDKNGCTSSSIAIITQPAVINIADLAGNVSCNGGNNGSISTTITGGTSPYTYSWSNGQTGNSATGLSAGTYTLTVTDKNGCTATSHVTITQPALLKVTLAGSNPLCNGEKGSATADPSGGTSPYTYSWSNGQTNNPATGLSVGTYTLTVTDNNGCTTTASLTITQPNALAANATPTSASCNSANDGSITLTVSGGTLPYTFLWSPNNSTTQNQVNLLAGVYTYTVTDANGCSVSGTVTVGAALSVFAAPGRDTVLCKVLTTIALNGTGSINATSYQWYQLPGMVALGSNQAIVDVTPPLGINIYELVVYNGICSDTSRDTIVVLPATANAGPDQTIFSSGSVVIGGSPTGTFGSTYYWSPDNFTLNDSVYANPIASPLITTVYTVTVKNAVGCIATDTVTVFINEGVAVPGGFSPNGDGINDVWALPFSQEFPNMQVEVYNRWGELLFHSDGYSIPWNGTYNGKILPIGTYYYVITLNDPRFPKALTGPVTILR